MKVCLKSLSVGLLCSSMVFMASCQTVLTRSDIDRQTNETPKSAQVRLPISATVPLDIPDPTESSSPSESIDLSASSDNPTASVSADQGITSTDKGAKLPIVKPLPTRVAWDDFTDAHYESFTNENHPYWYNPGKPFNEGLRASQNSQVSDLLKKYKCLWQAPDGHQTVYMTMDEGFEVPGHTPKLLELAREKNFKIHFFLTGLYIEKNPDLVKQMVDEGHIVCNHSVHHYAGPRVVNEKGADGYRYELNETNERFKAITGHDLAPFYRPPTGAYSERCLQMTNDLGYTNVFWSFAYRDWIQNDQPNEEEAYEKIVGQLHDGSIILMHATSATNVNIMGRVVDAIRARGYQLGNLYDAYELTYHEKIAP